MKRAMHYWNTVEERNEMKNEMKNEECTMCNRKAKYVVEDLAVGPRVFCSEECYATYVGLPIRGNGYYGLELIE